MKLPSRIHPLAATALLLLSSFTAFAQGLLVIRNTASGNGTENYNVSTGVNIGPIQTPNTTTSPWANF
ncbi:MAG: hypothetical protein V4819_11915 [Verrucomicrobiota bacterium]